jgi:hypothetical protein
VSLLMSGQIRFSRIFRVPPRVLPWTQPKWACDSIKTGMIDQKQGGGCASET